MILRTLGTLALLWALAVPAVRAQDPVEEPLRVAQASQGPTLSGLVAYTAQLARKVLELEREVVRLRARDRAYSDYVLWQMCRWNRIYDTSPLLRGITGMSPYVFPAGVRCPDPLPEGMSPPLLPTP